MGLRVAPQGLDYGLVGMWVVMVVSLGLVVGADAQDKKTVESRAKITIETSKTKIEDKSGAVKGAVSVIESNTDPKTYALVYQAPRTTADVTETVKYSDGTDHTVLVSVSTTPEPPTLTSNDVYGPSFKAIFILFIIATILESGLAVVFNWRPFIHLFDARGVKTIVSVVLAWFFVETFDLDIVTGLVNVYTGTSHSPSVPGVFITALVLAGGSSGVNNLLTSLGFRSMKTAAQITPKPPATEAWIAVRLIRNAAKGPVMVLIGPQNPPQPVAGTISGSSKQGLLRLFFRDYGRFPTAGGYAITQLGQPYAVQLVGSDSSSATIRSPVWGPYPLAAGAIVDIEVRL
jgi:hypothetical protein